jgi:hypothetical protein
MDCGAKGVKLWRRVAASSCIRLRCAKCSCKNQGVQNTIDSEGYIKDSIRKTDQIYSGKQPYGLCPAIPDVLDNGTVTWWGYTSVPQAGVFWWRALPNQICYDTNASLVGELHKWIKSLLKNYSLKV